ETPANSSRVRLCLQGQLSNFLERHSDIRRLRTQKGGGRAVCGKLAGIDRVRGQSALLIRGPNKKWDFSVHASGAEFGDGRPEFPLLDRLANAVVKKRVTSLHVGDGDISF